MPDYAALAAARDARVDADLGDLVFYQVPPAGPVQIKAFLLRDDPDEGHTTQDPAKGIWRLKVSRELVPMPSMDHRVTADALDGTYRPIPKKKAMVGTYWLVDLERVSR